MASRGERERIIRSHEGQNGLDPNKTTEDHEERARVQAREEEL